jgi:threonine dehydratase
VRTAIEDRPGELNQLLAYIAELKINVREMNYLPTMQSLPVQHVEVTLTLETRHRQHVEQLFAALHQRGYALTEIRGQLIGPDGRGS